MVDAHAMPAKEGIVCAAFNSHSTDFAKQGITNYAVLPSSSATWVQYDVRDYVVALIADDDSTRGSGIREPLLRDAHLRPFIRTA